jgi:transposase-like protein
LASRLSNVDLIRRRSFHASKAVRAIRHGHAHGLQRYRCRTCARTFNAFSGTPLARLRHKSRWLDYLDGVSPVRKPS